MHGFGIITDAKGDTYEGMWEKSKRSGAGYQKRVGSYEYRGNFANNKQEGHGVQTWTNGLILDGVNGQWHDDMTHGTVHATRPDGTFYLGTFQANKKHGPGLSSHTDGTVWKEVWEAGEMKR